MIEINLFYSGSSGNLYTVADGKTKLMIECGVGWKKIQQALDFQTDLAGCLVTHGHKDHSKAMAEVMKAGTDVYTSAGTWNESQVKMTHRGHIVEARKQFGIGTWTILPFDTQHDASEPLGFLMANQSGDKLLFATDTFYLKYRFVGLTHIMIECNYADDIIRANVEAGIVPMELKNRIIQSHFSLDNVKEFLKANDLSHVQEIHLIHLSNGNSDADRFKREIMQVTGKPVYIA